MVIDTSALLALLFKENHAGWCIAKIEEHISQLLMSTVNLSEVLILIRDRQPKLCEELEEQILTLPIRFVAPTVDHAKLAATARFKFPFNLGDCFAYALAKSEGCGVLTLDVDFRRADIEVLCP